MSTVKAVNFQHPSSSAVNLSLDSAGGVSGGLPSPNRNLLYNGAMQVSQRGTSTTGVTASGYFTADRWYVEAITLGTWTQDLQNDAPSGSGFRRSLRMLCTTADAAPAADDYIVVQQRLEGQDVQRIAKGTASAQQLTLSFWVKSNVTGTYTVSLYDSDNNRGVSAAYTVSASATWERKTVTFPADTTGAFDNDSSRSLDVGFMLAAGSNRTSGTLQTTWGSFVAANLAPGQVNLAAATNNYWQVTGVQLEVGPVATPFEFKSFGQELRECQRYYRRFATDGAPFARYAFGSAISTGTVQAMFNFNPPLRTYPSGGLDGLNLAVYDGSTVTAVSGLALDTGSTQCINVAFTASGATQFRPYQVIANNTTNSFVAFSAEL